MYRANGACLFFLQQAAANKFDDVVMTKQESLIKSD
jgi:hypothetical protein